MSKTNIAHKIGLGLATLALMGSAIACSPETAANHGADPGAGSNTVETTQPIPEDLPTESTASVPDDEPSEEAPSEEAAAKFGDTWTYEDGLQVTISELKSYKPSKDASDEAKDYKKFVVFTVTIKNNTGHRYDPGSFYTTASSGEDEVDNIWDWDRGIEGSPDTKILAGKSKHWKLVYGVNKGQDFVLEVSPGSTWDDESYYEEILYTS